MEIEKREWLLKDESGYWKIEKREWRWNCIYMLCLLRLLKSLLSCLVRISSLNYYFYFLSISRCASFIMSLPFALSLFLSLDCFICLYALDSIPLSSINSETQWKLIEVRIKNEWNCNWQRKEIIVHE